jgi:hypothetical protein
VTVHGDASVRGVSVADGDKSVLTVERIDATGIDGVWPERITLDRVRVRRSWALIERDRYGNFLLQALFAQPLGPAATPAPAAPAPAGPPIALHVRELILEQQAATIVDGVTSPPARFDVADARLTVQDLTWPSRGPMKADLSSPMPGGGRLTASGTVALQPLRIDGRVALDAVSIEQAQPYLPMRGKVAGQVTGDLAVKIALDPVTVRVTGQARMQRFGLSDGDRAVVTVGRLDVGGVDVDWPRRIAMQSVVLRRPRLLVERDAKGEIRLRSLVAPTWPTAENASPPAGAAPSGPARAAPVIDIATFTLERASARFVDHGTTPPYAEELSDVQLTLTPLTTDPGRPARFTGSGGIAGGTFKVVGTGLRERSLDLKVELRDFIVPRANPYLDRFTGWIATRGSLNATADYTLRGPRITASHDVVVRNLDVKAVEEHDEVERRVGLPFGFLVSLLKDARGDIKLTVPVSGDLSTREFDFQEAVWGAVRSLALRLVALPFSRIGSLFVSEDSKLQAVAITPVTFEPGTATMGAGMDAHLGQVADFLRGAPAMTLALEPIITQADVDARKGPTAAPDAMQTLGERRLEVVRGAFARAGIDAGRLQGRASRRPLVEAAGASRVEMTPRPGGA